VIHSLRRIASCALVTDIIVATRADEVARLEERIAKEKFKQTVRVVKGGDSRQESVAAALSECRQDTEIVLCTTRAPPPIPARIAALHHSHGLLELLLRDSFLERATSSARVATMMSVTSAPRGDAPQAVNHDRRTVSSRNCFGVSAPCACHTGGGKNGGDSVHIGSGHQPRTAHGRARKLQECTSSGARGRNARGELFD